MRTLAVIALIMSGTAAARGETTPAAFASIALGAGAGYDFLGVRLEIGFKQISLFAAAGLPNGDGFANFITSLPQGTSSGVDFNGYTSFVARYSFALGFRVYSEPAGGGFFSAQFASVAYHYHYDDGGLDAPGYTQFVTATGGYRHRFAGRFFVEGAAGLGVALVGNHSQPDDGGPHPFQSARQLWPDFALGVGLLFF